MKLETLAKRLAAKTNTPILEKVVLGQAPISDLPSECMIWTGAALYAKKRAKPRTLRSPRDGLRMDMIEDERPVGIIRHGKTEKGNPKTISVHRLIFTLAMNPQFEFRMWNDCGQPCCVNPMHFEVQETTSTVPEPPAPEVNTDWTEDDLEELLEFILAEQDPRSWEDIIGNPDLEGAPEFMVRDVLKRMNKEHLT